MDFDALLLLSFGGPEGPEDVMPFLANVLRGRNVPQERIEQVASHYMSFGGRSPINTHNRALLDALRAQEAAAGRGRPVYWGNRNWHPLLTDTLARMAADGIRRAAVMVTSAYSSYSSCRQYLDDIVAARRLVGAAAPELVKLRPYFNHPGFVLPFADGLAAALAEAPPDTPVLMSAHSIPVAMAACCDYERQLAEAARLVAGEAGVADGRFKIVFQSRSGPPSQPWLGPDIGEELAALAGAAEAVVVTPIGFVSDHMEVAFDLDTQAAGMAARLGTTLLRTPTPGSDPRFVRMVADLVDELEHSEEHPPEALGGMGPAACPCRTGCPPSQAT